MILSSSEVRAGTTLARSRKESGVIPLDSHLVKEYRIKFEQFFVTRYTPRRETRVDLSEYVRPFLSALGFSDYHAGPRYIEVTSDQFKTMQNVSAFVLRHKRTPLTNIEKHAITACASAAVLFTLGDDHTADYIKIEQEAIHGFGVDIDVIRKHAKEVYSRVMSRFDQYLTCCPITPIRWSAIEAPPKKKKADEQLLKETQLYGLFKGGELLENPWIARIRAKGLLD